MRRRRRRRRIRPACARDALRSSAPNIRIHCQEESDTAWRFEAGLGPRGAKVSRSRASSALRRSVTSPDDGSEASRCCILPAQIRRVLDQIVIDEARARQVADGRVDN